MGMRYGTGGYVISDKGILMLRKPERKEDPNSGFCPIPGGKLEPSEKGLKNIDGRVKSVIREVKNETGIIMINPLFVGTILFDNKDRTIPNWPNPDNFLVYYFKSINYSGELKESDEGVPFWAQSWEEINSLPKNKGDIKIYEWLRDGRNFVGVIKHQGNEMDEEGSWVDFY